MTENGGRFQGLALFYIIPLPSRYGKNPRRVVGEKISKIKHGLIFGCPDAGRTGKVG